MSEIMEVQRRRDFVAWHIKQYGWVGEFGQEGVCNDRWIGWNAALDSVCVELPPTMECDDHWTGDITVYDAAELCSAIERAGLKVKP